MNAFERLNHHQPLFAEARGDIQVSFEFFPPKTRRWPRRCGVDPDARAARAALRLRHLRRWRLYARAHPPDRRADPQGDPLTPAAHLTCVGASRGEVDDIAREYWDLGVRNIVALRGDPSEAGAKYQPHPDGYRDAAELVAGLKKVAPFDISVAAYPEIHPDSSSRAFDLENLKRKVDAGADRAITQFFFSPECFFRFRDEAAAAGIDIEIVPGILPVSNVATTRRFAQTCGATIPQWLDGLFEGLDELPAARQLIAATVAAELCGQLYAGGVRHFHFYTLNRAELSYAICHLLGVRAKT